MALTEERVSTFRTNDQDTSGLAVTPQAAEWTVVATADNAIASVSKAAVTGKAHYITAVHASFSAAAIKLLIWSDGTTERRMYVHNQRDIAFSEPVKVDDATAFVGSLAASGTGAVIGALTVHGYTA